MAIAVKNRAGENPGCASSATFGTDWLPGAHERQLRQLARRTERIPKLTDEVPGSTLRRHELPPGSEAYASARKWTALAGAQVLLALAGDRW